MDRGKRHSLLALALGALLVAPQAFAVGPFGQAPLTAVPGDPARGLAVIRDQSRASCLICHTISSLPDPDQGVMGPPLGGVALAYDAQALRARIMDSRRLSADTIMPPYFTTEGLYRVGMKWQGQTIYSAQDVEDVVAFLLTLKD
jgi:sulfur-oxidizing protein SoxX